MYQQCRHIRQNVGWNIFETLKIVCVDVKSISHFLGHKRFNKIYNNIKEFRNIEYVNGMVAHRIRALPRVNYIHYRVRTKLKNVMYSWINHIYEQCATVHGCCGIEFYR